MKSSEYYYLLPLSEAALTGHSTYWTAFNVEDQTIEIHSRIPLRMIKSMLE